MDLITYAVPFFILAMLFELAWGWKTGRNTYRVNDAVSSLFLGVLSQARRFITLGVGGLAYHAVATHFSMPQLSPQSPWTWVLAMLLYDFCYYWLHRMGHERRLLWAAHVAHHQSEDYNLSTALRQTSTGFLFSWLFYLPLFALGIPAEVVVTVGSLNLIYQFWVHTEHVGKLGWYESIFVTPSNHRVHHAQNTRYLDRNYGGLLIIWDRLFGTFQEELKDEPPVFGIRGPLHSWNPLVALSHVYMDMLRDFWNAPRWADKWRVVIARTGWRPAGLAPAALPAETALADFQCFDPTSPRIAKAYAIFQLAAMVLLLACLQLGLVSSYAVTVALVMYMLFSMICTAQWLEGPPSWRCLGLDLLRWILAAFVLAVVVSAPDLSGSLRDSPLIKGFTAYLIINAIFVYLLCRSDVWGSREMASDAA